MESPAKKQSQQQNGINYKLTVLKKQQAARITFLKLQIWATIAANAMICLPYYNKNNKIVVKLNNIVLTEEIKNQAPKKLPYRIDAYLIKNNTTTNKICMTQISPSKDIIIQTTSKKEIEMLKKEDNQIKILGNKAKLAQKRYQIVIIGISIVKINRKKTKEIKKKFVMPNSSLSTTIKIVSIFWLFALKKNQRTLSLVIKKNDAKMAIILIEK